MTTEVFHGSIDSSHLQKHELTVAETGEGQLHTRGCRLTASQCLHSTSTQQGSSRARQQSQLLVQARKTGTAANSTARKKMELLSTFGSLVHAKEMRKDVAAAAKERAERGSSSSNTQQQQQLQSSGNRTDHKEEDVMMMVSRAKKGRNGVDVDDCW